MYFIKHVSTPSCFTWIHTQREKAKERINRPNGVADDDLLPAIDLSGLCNPDSSSILLFSTLQTMIGTNFNGQPISTVFFWSFDAGQPDGIVQWTKNIYTYFLPSKRCWQKRGGNSWKWISKSLQVFLLVCMCPSLCVISRQTCVKYKREKKFRQRVKFSVQSFDHSLFSCS